MVIAMLDMNVKPGRLDDFKAWVGESNGVISGFEGFVSRRLLEAPDGSLRMMVEFETEEQFRAMRQSAEHKSVHKQAEEFRDPPSRPVLYRVVAGQP